MKTDYNAISVSRSSRKQRLTLGKKWIQTYNGENIIKGYSKRFGVDKLCAIKELEMLGVEISDERKQQIVDAQNVLIKNRQKRKEENKKNDDNLFESDEHFTFIAGYTSGGAPFGPTWEEPDDEFIYELE